MLEIGDRADILSSERQRKGEDNALSKRKIKVVKTSVSTTLEVPSGLEPL